jgi:hypothetical protein
MLPLRNAMRLARGPTRLPLAAPTARLYHEKDKSPSSGSSNAQEHEPQSEWRKKQR